MIQAYPSGSNYEDLVKEGKKIIMFSAPWCGPCKGLTPIMDNLSEELSLDVYKVNIEEEVTLTEAMSITSVPTIIFYNNGEVKHRQTGATTAANIKKTIEEKL